MDFTPAINLRAADTSLQGAPVSRLARYVYFSFFRLVIPAKLIFQHSQVLDCNTEQRTVQLYIG